MVPVSQNQQLIERFLDALWLEHGLRDNTLKAYRADLEALARHLRDQDVTLSEAGPQHLHSLLHTMFQREVSARTVARSLSTYRRFYRYLLRENQISADPSAEIVAPKLGRTLRQKPSAMHAHFHHPRAVRASHPQWRQRRLGPRWRLQRRPAG